MSQKPSKVPPASSTSSPRVNPLPRRRWVTTPAASTPSEPNPAPELAGGSTDAENLPRPKASETGEKRAARGDKPGYCNPPKRTQFQPGNPGGPGRPKGSRSQDSLWREELNTRRPVRIDGRMQKVTKRELAVKMLANTALEKKDPKLLFQVIQVAERLFPEAPEAASAVNVLGDSRLDQQILAQFMASLSLGEPNPAVPQPFADLGLESPDLAAGIADGDWHAGAPQPEEIGQGEEDDHDA